MDIYYILLIFFIIFFSILSWRRFDVALYFIILGLPSYLIRFNIGWLPMTLLEVMILISFIIWLFKIHRNDLFKLSSYFKNISVLIGSFLVLSTVAMFVGPDIKIAAGIWKAYFVEPILFLIMFITIIKKENLYKIFYIFSFSVLMLSIVAIYQKITGNFIPNEFWSAAKTRRVVSIFEYPNALSLYLAPVVIIVLGWLANRLETINKKIVINIFLFIVFILGLISIYFTKSKGALLGILVGIVFYALFYKGLRKYFLSSLAILFIVGFVYFVFFNNAINLKGVSTVEGGDSVTIRMEMWQESLEMLKNKPILGAGLAGYREAVRPYHQREYIEIYLYPHNLFLNFWSEIGVLGLLIFLLVVGWFYYSGIKEEDNVVIVLMAGMTTLLVHGLVDVPYFKNDLSILFWIIIGAMIVVRKKTFGEKSKNRV